MLKFPKVHLNYYLVISGPSNMQHLFTQVTENAVKVNTVVPTSFASLTLGYVMIFRTVNQGMTNPPTVQVNALTSMTLLP